MNTHIKSGANETNMRVRAKQ